MSKFNRVATRPAATSPVATATTPTAVTHEGGPGFARDAKSELFLLAVANMVSEKTFYESADARDDRYEALIQQVAVADPAWMLGFIGWLRGDANMRSASLVAAVEAVRARLAAGADDGPVRNRQLIAAAMQRADEPGELLAYWMGRYGERIPKPIKRGVGDAVVRLYTQRSLLKYDTASKGLRFGRVLDLVHPIAASPEQGDLFAHALNRMHGRDSVLPAELGVLVRNTGLRNRVAAGHVDLLLDADNLRAAGMSWEDALSLAGSHVDKARLWEALIPSMGIMALARNLRNFDEAGVSDKVAATVAARFADPAEVAKSRMFPFRWLAAYRAAPSLRWGHALDQALTASLANVPALPGRTLILVDVSGSMADCMSGRSELNRADAAGVFGAALALRAADPTLVWFNHTSGQVQVPRGGSLLRLVESIPKPNGGTETTEAVRRWLQGHDRVVIITDEQAGHGWYGGNPADEVPARTPLYTWNLAGYQHGHGPSGGQFRHTFGGLTDQAFGMIPLLEAQRSCAWPWEQTQETR
ncbi:TROVE domain-containing protein [Micromonospora sp. WMMD737]|uniref:TROVE domain-containing protein n=1 Tax=Micromonospora sp. WMMD737 TaxID=3404113 RepID=UPI003B95C10E